MITPDKIIATRYRAHNRAFRKPLLVLQVGIARNTGHDDETTPPSCQGRGYTSWHDARVEDLAQLSRLKDDL